MKKSYILLTALAAWFMMAGCSDEFLNRPPQDALVDANFFKNDEQVLSNTAPLYSAAWKSYVDKANFKLGDIRGGTVFRAWGDRDAVELNVTGVSESNEQAYQAFYVVIAQANMAIYNINKYAGPDVSPEIKQHAIAEARFMRATAYTHLTMNYKDGAVPIIENNLDYIFQPQLKRNTEESVWEFILRDYEFAAANLLEESIQPGRITKWSAEGMLARTHLTLAGVGASPGARDQAHADKAKEYADRVITMSGKKLLDDYASLFRFPYDNNEESLFELEWVYTNATNGYEASNSMISQITYSNDIAANGDGWGGDLSATLWLLSKYEGLVVDDGATPGFTLDQRLKASFMLPGFTYPELINNATNQPHVFPDPGAAANSPNYASIKKYVIGKIPGQTDKQRYPNNTYMMRLAEMYLIYADAALGNSGSTSDAKAVQYFNAVHERAGLSPVANVNALTFDVVFDERIKEFAMESMAWYDLVRLHYYDPQGAYGRINEQYRGLFLAKPNQWPNPTAWTFTKYNWAVDHATVSINNFELAIPSSELSQAPTLNDEPVPYDFSN